MGIISRAHLLRYDGRKPETLLDRMDALAAKMDEVLAKYPPGTGAFPAPKRREPGTPPKPAWFLGASKKNAGPRRTG